MNSPAKPYRDPVTASGGVAAESGGPVDTGAVRDMAVRIGVEMNEAGDSVGSIADTISRILKTQGVPDASALIFPTAVMVRSGEGADTGVQFSSSVWGAFRLDQIASLYTLVKKLTKERIDPAVVTRDLDAIQHQPPLFSAPLRVFGHGVLTLGFALMLQPTPQTLIFAFAVGLLIGALKLVQLPTIQIVFPVLVAFIVTIIALVAHQNFGFEDPVRILVPPLITFLPGGALTIGIIELTTNQMMSGASRLVSAFVQLLLLAFGVLAATQMLRVPLDVLQDNPLGQVGPWIMLIAIPVYAVGLMLQYCAPPNNMPWILLVLAVAYLGQLAGTLLFGAQLSGFFGALAMTPLVMFIDQLPKGPSKMITFLPAFWMLVPGAAGLIALVGMGSDSSTDALSSVFVTIIAIALGVLIGVALFNSLHKGTRTHAHTAPPQ